jgi:hypothetical protein
MDTLITNPYYIIDYSMLIFWDAQRLVREYVFPQSMGFQEKTDEGPGKERPDSLSTT